MRFQTVSTHFTKETTIPQEWLTDFDITLVPNFNSTDYGSAVDSQVKRTKVLHLVFPELKTTDLRHNLVILGQGALDKMLHQLNSAYKPILITTEKLTAQDYANYIKQQLLPISQQGYIYFHDVYFHAAGVHNIPDTFTKWWQTNHMRLNPTESVMMASIVEWTTLKGVSPIMEDMFVPERWTQLELFFMGQDRQICNAKNLNQVYQKFMPLMRKVLSEWNRL
jgi:hypothetical protein